MDLNDLLLQNDDVGMKKDLMDFMGLDLDLVEDADWLAVPTFDFEDHSVAEVKRAPVKQGEHSFGSFRFPFF
jgi:hypothetical protein